MTGERKVALGLLFTIFVQTAGVFVWTGAAAQRLERVEHEVDMRRDGTERLVRVETEIIAMRKQLDRIERKIDRE